MTRYERSRQVAYIMQVRTRGSNEIWCATGMEWHMRKRDAMEEKDKAQVYCPELEYRVVSYMPEASNGL